MCAIVCTLHDKTPESLLYKIHEHINKPIIGVENLRLIFSENCTNAVTASAKSATNITMHVRLHVKEYLESQVPFTLL